MKEPGGHKGQAEQMRSNPDGMLEIVTERGLHEASMSRVSSARVRAPGWFTIISQAKKQSLKRFPNGFVF